VAARVPGRGRQRVRPEGRYVVDGAGGPPHLSAGCVGEIHPHAGRFAGPGEEHGSGDPLRARVVFRHREVGERQQGDVWETKIAAWLEGRDDTTVEENRAAVKTEAAAVHLAALAAEVEQEGG